MRKRTFEARGGADNAAVQAPAIPNGQNELLAALPRKGYGELEAALSPVALAFGEVLYEPGEPIAHVYFPCTSMVSLLAPAEGHAAVEVGMVGREGMVGASLALGIGQSPLRALVQGEGGALRMSAARFRLELTRNPALQSGLDRYIDSLMAQIAQTAVCNRFHVIEARLARWLLMTRDRVRAPDFRMTHEFLATMLGVRRVGITEAAGELQRRKLIGYSRGVLRILDSRGLESACCACYQRVGASAAGR